jgi:hypothetical protein
MCGLLLPHCSDLIASRHFIVMSNTDNSDFTPRADESKESSSSDQDTLAEKNRTTGEASKKRSAAQKAAKPAKKLVLIKRQARLQARDVVLPL